MATKDKRMELMGKRMASLKTAASASGRFKQDISEETPVSSMNEEERSRVVYLTDKDLLDDPDNILVYGEDPDEELVLAMKENGFQGVILAYPVEQGKYRIESGHRRRAAARKAGIKEYPVYVTQAPSSDPERMLRLLMSNLHARKYTPMRTARICQRLYDTHKELIEMKKKDGTLKPGDVTALNALVAIDMEMNDSTVERYRALLNLIKPLQDLADSGEYSWSDLSKASVLPVESQEALYEMICDRVSRFGSDSITRVYLQDKIAELKVSGPPSKTPETEETRHSVPLGRGRYSKKTFLKNLSKTSEMIKCDIAVKNYSDLDDIIKALEEMKTGIDGKIRELTDMKQ